MDRSPAQPPARGAIELERALHEWIAASRRAYDPSRRASDVTAEQAAWGRVRSVLETRDTAPAAA